jgi:hypothetical protein
MVEIPRAVYGAARLADTQDTPWRFDVAHEFENSRAANKRSAKPSDLESITLPRPDYR